MINKTKDREHGFKYLFDLVRDSDVKNIEIICGFDQNREKNNKKEKVSPLEIVDLFKEEVLNNVFSSYSEDVTKETHAENVFNNLDLTKWRSNNTKENENNDINLIKNKDLKLEIKISIIKHSYFKTRDRFIIFDEHSAVDIHDINSWSTSNGRLNKDTLCSILTPRTKLLEFDRYSKMPELAFIKPIKYYQ